MPSWKNLVQLEKIKKDKDGDGRFQKLKDNVKHGFGKVKDLQR